MADRLVVPQPPGQVRASGPGVEVRGVDLGGGENLSSDGVPAHTVDLAQQGGAGVELSRLTERTEALPLPAGGVEDEEDTKQVNSDGGRIMSYQLTPACRSYPGPR